RWNSNALRIGAASVVSAVASVMVASAAANWPESTCAMTSPSSRSDVMSAPIVGQENNASMSRSYLADAERAEQVSAHRFAGIVLFTLQPLPAFDPSPYFCLPRLK